MTGGDHPADLVRQQRHRPEQPGPPPQPRLSQRELDERPQRRPVGELGRAQQQRRLPQPVVHPVVGVQRRAPPHPPRGVPHEEQFDPTVRPAPAEPPADRAVPQRDRVGPTAQVPLRQRAEGPQLRARAYRLHGEPGLLRDLPRAIPSDMPVHQGRPALPRQRGEPLDVRHPPILRTPHPVGVPVRDRPMHQNPHGPHRGLHRADRGPRLLERGEPRHHPTSQRPTSQPLPPHQPVRTVDTTPDRPGPRRIRSTPRRLHRDHRPGASQRRRRGEVRGPHPTPRTPGCTRRSRSPSRR